MADERPWYFKDSTVVWAALLLLALALPLLWWSPYYSIRRKIVVSVIIIVGTYISWLGTAYALNTLAPYLDALKQGV